MRPRDVGIMRRYGSSWAYLRAERMLRLPTYNRDSRLNHDSRAQECPSVGRALIMRVITRRCVGRFWNV